MRTIFIGFVLLLAIQGVLFGQTAVTGITTSTQTATSSSYTSSSITYNWGQSSDEYLDGIEISGTSYVLAEDIYQRVIQFKRVDNSNASGERCQVFVERSSDTNLDASYPEDESGDCSMIKALYEPIINRGALDVFHNVQSGVEYPNNIERVDVLTMPMAAPASSLLDDLGFLATEKRGNNDFKAAAILSLDVNGDPASYGNLVTVDGTPSYGNLGTTYDFRFFRDASSSPHGLPEAFYNSSEQTGFSLITFDDLGLSQGDIIYGISFFGRDVVSGTHTLTDPSTFPDDTDEGADIHGGLGAIFHTSKIILTNLIDTDGDGVADGDDIDDDDDGILDTDEGYTYAVAGSSFSDGDAVSSGSNIFTSGSINPTLTLTDNTGNTWFIDMTWETSEFGDPDGGGLKDGLLVDGWSNNVSTHPVQISLELDFNSPVENLLLNVGDIDGSNGSDEESIEVFAYDADDNLISLSSSHFPFMGSNLERSGNKVSPSADAWPGNNLTTNSFQLSFSEDVSRIVLDGYDGQDNLYFNINGVTYGTSSDQDGDGVGNHVDIDADNDGITDNVEAQSTSGYVAPSGTDTDGDGLDDAYDSDCSPCGAVTGVSLSPEDTDNDGTEDFLDSDSDDDGVADSIEGHDTNGDGTVDGSDSPNANTGLAGGTTDSDGDGLYDGFDNNTSSWDATNSSLTAESHPDVLFGTTEQDWREGPDGDRDGVPNSDDLDDDNDGIPDADECADPTITTLSFGSPSYEASLGGADGVDDYSVGDVYRYSTVTTGVDALVEILADDPAVFSINSLDNKPGSDIGLALHTDLGASGLGLLELQYTLVDAGTTTPTALNFIAASIDVDGAGDIADIFGFSLEESDAYSLESTTQLSSTTTGADIYFKTDPISADVSNVDPDFLVSATFVNRSQVKLIFGVDNGGSSERNRSIVLDFNGSYITNFTSETETLLKTTCTTDSDGDGLANSLDLDSDGDGIADIIEAGGTDSDGDGQVDYSTAGDPTTMTDADGDGLFDTVDDQDSGSGGGEVTSGTALSNPDSDSDGVKDVVDIDSDNDGITDNVEAQTTAGYTVPTSSDTDGDGIDNAYDGDDNTTTGIGGGTGTAISPTNTDNDALDDYLDSDSDNDGVADSIEGHDTNGDGTVDGSDSPNANTGLAGGTTDSDGDGLYDGFDNNTSSWDATNSSLTAESHPDVQAGGTTEQDWREGPDNDLDGIADAIDLDDDNDGIPDLDECDLSLSTSNVDFTGLSTSGGSYDTDDAANTLFTTTVSASTFTPGTGDDNTYDVRAATGNSTTGMRYEEGADGTIGSTVSNTLTFSHSIPVELRAGSTYGGVNSIMNRSGDRFVWEAVGASEGFTWVVNNAVFPGGGGSATVSGDGRTLTIEAGAGTGSANQAQFYVSTNGTLTGINVSMETIATLTGVINAAQFSLRIPLLCDADGDGIFNDFDLDSDADGIADIIEAGGTDSDGDGQVDYGTAGDPSTMTDADGDGLFDTVDDQDSGSGGGEVTSGTALTDPDSDSDGLENRIDIDSDADGITDNNEAQTSSGYTAPAGSDTDGDGIDNAYDGDDNTTTGIGGGTGTAISPTNTDEEADLPDYLDTDSDEDGESDTIEAYDTDDDGVADTTPAGTDTDGDGLDDNFDSNVLSSAASTNPNDNGETPGGFRDTDIVGGEPNWREPTAGGAPAPIELLSFSVYSLSNGTVKILWQTLTETNNDFFTIERSRDAENWEELAYVKGSGNSQEKLSYQEIDRQPFLETSYYRLKQTDYNGDFSYSQIMDIYMDPGHLAPLEVFPNPARGFLSIEGAPDELSSFTFYDVVGKDVTAQVHVIYRDDFQIQLDISRLPRGVYLLKTKNETRKVEKE